MSLQPNTDVFDDNFSYINNVNLKIIFISNIVTILIFVLSILGIFSVTRQFCYVLITYSVISSIIDYILVKYATKHKKLATIFSLLVLEGFITLAGTNPHIGIYLTFCIIPFVSTLYYNRKLTFCINIASYFLMLISLFFKWKSGAIIFSNSDGHTAFMYTYFPFAVGLTIEYSIIFLISLLLTQRNNHLLSSMAGALSNLKMSHKKIKEKNEQLENTQVKIIAFVAECLGSHDLFTGRHVLHTKEYVSLICNKMKESGFYSNELTQENIVLFTNAAFLHDIGKIHIPEGILNKIGRFSNEEFELMKSHTTEGRKLLEFFPIIGDGKFNKIATDMAYCHHEKWNGTGYPRRIKEKEIPLCARIVAAADVLDALISQRLYKEPMSIDEAMQVFEDSKGNHFEPCIADSVIACKEQIIEIDRKFKEEESADYNEELQWWSNYHQNFVNKN